MQVFFISHRTMAAPNVHSSFHHSGNGNNSMVRKHRTMQRRRQYQQRVIAWWIKLTIPPLLLWLIYYFGTSSSILRTDDDKKHNNNDKGNDATKKKKKKKSSSDSGSTIALWMQQQEEERTGDTFTSTSTSSSSAHCIANIVASIAADVDGKVGGSLDIGRDEAVTILQQSLACFVPPPVVVVEEESSSSQTTTTTTRTIMTTTSIRSVWIAGSTAAAGYGNQKHQSYPALLQQAWSSTSSSSLSSKDNSNASGNTNAVDVGRETTEFPLAWCRRASVTGSSSRRQMVLYDFQDDVYHFNTTRLRDFVTYVQPTILILRLSNDHDIASQHEIVQYLSSLVVGASAAPEQEPRSGGGSLSTTASSSSSSSVRAVYVIDVSSLKNNDDNDKGVVFGVAHSPDRLHPHHLTVAQHKRVAQIVRLLMRHHGFDDTHHDGDKDESTALIDNEQLDGSSNGDTASFWHCASGFGDATTTGRTPGSLHFVVAKDDQQKNNISRNSINLATVLPNCCGNSMDSVLLPNQDLRHLHWMWDALDASAKRRDLPFDQYGHTDWKIVVSGTPSSGSLQVVLPVAPDASSAAATGVRTVAVSQVQVCGDCDGMIVSSSAASSGVDADGDEATTYYSLHPIGYGCFDVTPPAAAFFITVQSGTCQISHILWQ
jgi:hypothetical protein